MLVGDEFSIHADNLIRTNSEHEGLEFGLMAILVGPLHHLHELRPIVKHDSRCVFSIMNQDLFFFIEERHNT